MQEIIDKIAAQVGTRAYPSLAALAGQLDAVSVAVPTESHAVVAEPLLAAGVSVLVEKPMAVTVADCDVLPPAPVQVRVYVLLALIAPVD